MDFPPLRPYQHPFAPVNTEPTTPSFTQAVVEEQELSPEKRVVANVGKMDAKKHLASNVTGLMSANIVQAMGTMLATVVF